MSQWPNVRDVTLFVAGLLGVAHEVLVTNVERPSLLVLFAAMMGLPAFLRKDEQAPPDDKPKRNRKGSG